MSEFSSRILDYKVKYASLFIHLSIYSANIYSMPTMYRHCRIMSYKELFYSRGIKNKMRDKMSYSIVSMIEKLQLLFKKLKATIPLLELIQKGLQGRFPGINEIQAKICRMRRN